MTEINCDVIKDMLPLYADEVVSESSRKLIEEHINSCPGCSAYLQKLKEDLHAKGISAYKDDIAIFRKIHKTIRKKRLLMAVIAAIGAVLIFAGLFYFIYVAKVYIPFEKTGLYTENGVLKTDLPAFSTNGFTLTGYPETMFIYMETTRYEQLFSGEPGIKREFTFSETEPGKISPDIHEKTYQVKEIYYVSADMAGKLSSGQFSNKEDGLSEDEVLNRNASRVESLKAESQLVWKLDGQGNETE